MTFVRQRAPRPSKNRVGVLYLISGVRFYDWDFVNRFVDSVIYTLQLDSRDKMSANKEKPTWNKFIGLLFSIVSFLLQVISDSICCSFVSILKPSNVRVPHSLE